MKHNDGIIKFKEDTVRRGKCSHCDEDTLVWELKEVILPDHIEASTKLIIYTNDASPPGYKLIRQIGIGCGCYARFHRQVAHIQDRKKR